MGAVAGWVGRAVARLAAALALLALLAGVPAGLAWAIGWPLPTTLPTSWAGWQQVELTAPPLLDDAAELLAAGSIDVIGYASTSTAYAIGYDDEAAMVLRLSRRTGEPVAATCASAVLALRVLSTGSHWSTRRGSTTRLSSWVQRISEAKACT